VDDSIERGLECGPSEQEPPWPVRGADSLGQGRRAIAVETVKAQGDSRPPDPSVARRAHLTIARRWAAAAGTSAVEQHIAEIAKAGMNRAL